MTIPDDVIDGYLRMLFGRSEPGDTIHHLLVAAAEPAARSPLGLVQPDKLAASVYAIAPDDSVDTDEFIAKVVVAAAIEAHKAGQVIHFAGLAVEAYSAYIPDSDEVAENLARRLEADGKLQEHPNAVEVTRLYAACSDGRRWIGTHVLSGPTAGAMIGPDLRVGALAADERPPHQRLIRNLVSPMRQGGTP